MTLPVLEPWLDKRGLAAHLACSVRSIEHAVAEGMPHAVIFGRVKFHASEVEPWLEARGHLQRHINGADIVPDNDRPGSAPTPPGPDTEE